MVVAVYVKTFPFGRLPLLKLVPLSEVTVWVIPSLLVHLTISPTCTVTEEGEKAPPVMLMLNVTGAAVVVNVTWLPYAVPAEFVAYALTKYAVPAVRPVKELV